MAQATALIKAYMEGTIPDNGGFVLSAVFDPGSIYSIYECTAYRNVKDVTRTPDGIVFKSDGNRTHMLVEPPIYPLKHIEPVNRDDGHAIPYRFNELTILTGKKSEKIMVPEEPRMLYTSFTIADRRSDYFAYVFYPTPDVYVAIKKFLADSLYNDCNISKQDSIEAATAMLATIKKFVIWKAD
ncbi:MAG TPA: hypothetical protein PKM65_17890 [Spirochaetota bacterium]|nr:hypothetical protein [Spirochaetota bacterium]HNT13064.1 hypothetical protein [Spirochaetota bacterium]HNV48849.1 hypothetical protein [Spirochaetota bacterium]HOS39234.1 hypothetical protein [Spirochaetota bacterium]HPI23303.1 hypothetical protein [Spirochaetota bacterium]